MRTYQDPDFVRASRPGPVAWGFLAATLIVLLTGMPILAFADGFTLADRAEVALGLALFIGCLYLSDRRHRQRTCTEIRLGDDGTCELETKRAVIHLHVNQIASVEYARDPDSRADYFISYQGGSVPVTKGMTDFADFLNRLRALNPAVELTSFPPDTWPDLGVQRRKEPWSVNCLFRTALFPLLVVGLLVWMATVEH